MEEQAIYYAIYHFIYKDLGECIDDYVFEAASMEELGREYFQRVICADESFTEDRIKAVLRMTLPSDTPFADDRDYYIGMCSLVGISTLPKDSKLIVKQKYDEVFLEKRESIFSKYDAAIQQLITDEEKNKNDIQCFLESFYSSSDRKKLNFDISSKELDLLALYQKQDELRSRIDSLRFIKQKCDEFLLRFCDYQAPEIVENKIRRFALDVCQYRTELLSIEFSPYETMLSCLEDDIDRPYVLFFKIKQYSIQQHSRELYHNQSSRFGAECASQSVRNYLKDLPGIDELHEARITDPNHYLTLLRIIMSKYDVLEEIKRLLDASVCLFSRRDFLLKVISLYEHEEFDVVNGILPTQIEGIFYDLLIDMTTFSRFSDLNLFPKVVLKDKIVHLTNLPDGIYIEATEYFHNYYNNMVRNPVAHGKFYGNSSDPVMNETLAIEQLLDMGFLIYMASRISETDKMHRLIEGYTAIRTRNKGKSDSYFNTLFHDLIGQRTYYDFDMVSKYSPIHLVYWIVNPYYEKKYALAHDVVNLYALRDDLLSAEFWRFVLKVLESQYNRIDKQFKTVIQCLFQCDLSDDTKAALIKVSAKYDEIRKRR